MARRLHLCEQLLLEEGFYFPHQLDRRGRVYCIPQIVHPQADDLGRALLEFADGKPLGSDGARWLAVHLANMYGHNKVLFEARIEWVREFEKDILDSASDPLRGRRFWQNAKRPWCFLAACYEWERYQKVGDTCSSHLPIHMDGTCNGLQHLSALGRDRIGGEATNLLPSVQFNDVYQRVASVATLRLDRSGRHAEPDFWMQVDRDLVKRATMTTPYGVTKTGIRRQLIKEHLAQHKLDSKSEWRLAGYLANVLRGAISEVVVKASEIMRWLRDVARQFATADRGVRWTLPTGFVVVHEYRKRKERRIVTADRTLVIHEDDPTLRLRKRKQVNGIAPNLVHSLDAAHMMLTINRLVDCGVRDFAMVHDSYAVHGTDITLMNEVLREQFVSLHEQVTLQAFFSQLQASNPDIPLPAPPSIGDLDVRSVMNSEYFFA